MNEEELKEKMNKDLHEIFDVKATTNFMFDLIQKAYLRGIETGMKINGPNDKRFAEADSL